MPLLLLRVMCIRTKRNLKAAVVGEIELKSTFSILHQTAAAATAARIIIDLLLVSSMKFYQLLH